MRSRAICFWYSIDDFLKTMPYLVGLCFVLGLLFQTKTHSKAHPTFATEIYPPPTHTPNSTMRSHVVKITTYMNKKLEPREGKCWRYGG